MWRAYFYEKTWVGRWINTPVATILWVCVLLGTAYNHAISGELQPWALSIIGIGLVLFLITKIQMIRKGRLFTFGVDISSNQPWHIALPYIAGYICMIIGFIISFR